jgi:ABC-2 type transport system ATP-binding protein
MSAATVERLRKRFGDLTAVDDVSFEIERGTVTALLGPNGAGKTTTIEILEGFATPDMGTVRVLGCEPRRGGRRWRARIGAVLQSSSLDTTFTARELLHLYRTLYPRARSVAEVVELMDLADFVDQRVGALSGGQLRRVDVALATVGNPELLFLDEPTTGLDPEARQRLWSAITNLTASGTTVIVTTHYLDEADRAADRVLVMSAGRIVADTTPDSLRTHAGQTLIRYRLPRGIQSTDLPASLHNKLRDGDLLEVRTVDTGRVLSELLAWARCKGLDLAGLEVAPPSLEDAYLALVAGAAGSQVA